MNTKSFIGTWTYRSFHDLPDEVDDFNLIRLWQAKLTLEADGPNFIRGSLSNQGYELTIKGCIFSNTEAVVIKFRAEGLNGTPTEGWIYDYSGALTYNWPDGDHQRSAIVGTVIRTAPHQPGRAAGLTYSFVAVNKDYPTTTYQLPQKVLLHFADRLHRLHHAVWHGIRGYWYALNENDKKALKDLDWDIPDERVALMSPGERTRPAITNGSGEDFLFFHRQMVVTYKSLMAEESVQIIEWREIPQPGFFDGIRSLNAVPNAWSIPNIPHLERRFASVKSDDFFWSRMRWWDYQFKDPTYLSSLTLGELGALIEFSVHNDMHIRWSDQPRDPDTNQALPLGRPDSDISSKWDNPKYDWLGEFYSSHVNPVFWRLHGWIDDRINDWYAAHEWKHPGEVKVIKKGGVEWFQVGKWVKVEHPWVWPDSLGGYETGHDHHHPELRKKRIESAEKVMAILYPTKSVQLSQHELTGATPELRSNIIGGI